MPAPGPHAAPPTIEARPSPKPPAEPGKKRAKAPGKTWSDEQLLAALERLATTGVSPKGTVLNYFAGQIANAVLARPLKVPRELIEGLLARDEVDLRWLAFRLVRPGSPIPARLMRNAALGDPKGFVRYVALYALANLYPRDPELPALLVSAARDTDSRVRQLAVMRLASLISSGHPELAGLVLEATRDPDSAVRYEALRNLSAAGEAGAARAVEMILDGEYDTLQLETLAEVAAEGGRALDLLGDEARPEIVTALLNQLDPERDDETVRSLAGQFEALLPLYQPEDGLSYQYARFFKLAVAAGDRDLIDDVIGASKHEATVRVQALRVALDTDESQGLVSARRMLLDENASARLRARAVRILIEKVDDRKDPGAFRALLEEIAAKDPSIWVREQVKKGLREKGF